MGTKLITSRAIIGILLYELSQVKPPKWVSQISPTPFKSNSSEEEYAGLGMPPVMREWVGGRQAKGFSDKNITVKNKHFEATLKVLAQELRRDKTGQLRLSIGGLADRTNSHWASLLSTLIINGASGDCFDGKKFFATNHAMGKSGAQSNSISCDISAYPIPATAHGSTTNPSVEELALAILEAIQKILSYKDDQGEPINEDAMSFQVQVPITFYTAAAAAVAVPTFATGATNVIKSTNFNIEIVPNPRLTFTTQFVVFRTDGRLKPFILQEEEAVTVKAIAEGSELEFETGEHHYGVEAWRNVAYWAWYYSCLVTLA